MIDIKKRFTLPLGLANFTNSELYFIISKLFGLGSHSKSSKGKERLFICFENTSKIKFLFLNSTMLDTAEGKLTTYIYFGEFDQDFEDVLIYGDNVPHDIINADQSYLGDGTKISQLIKDTDRIFVKPFQLVNGLWRLISENDFMSRKANQAFSITKRHKLLNFCRYEFGLFAKLDRYTNSYKDFSGNYLLVAEPRSTANDYQNSFCISIHEYSIKYSSAASDIKPLATSEVIS